MDETEINIDEILSKSTVRDDLSLSVSGSFPSQEAARELLNAVMGFAKIFGSVFDLSALDGITIADDYVAALNSIDRGYPDMKGTMSELREILGTFFVRASYLTGHTDGLGRPLEEEAPKLAAALRQTTWFNTIWTRGINILREMFAKIESWEGV